MGSPQDNLPPPPGPAPKSPEQLQLENLQGSIQCANFVLSVVRKEPLTLQNIQMAHGAVAWLESLETLLRKDYADVYSRMPQNAPTPPAIGKRKK